MEYQASNDRLSNLPLSIIDEILVRVPIRDAIRTCVLSRQWRYNWTTLPCLLFKYDDVNEDSLEDGLMKEFGKRPINFITNVLTHHKGPIHKFEMYFPLHDFNFKRIEEWVHYLSRSSIKELIIKMKTSWDYRSNLLKSSIYSCAKLRRLELRNFRMDPPPSTFKGFLFLTSLSLSRVQLSPYGFETLIGNCPLLERLKVEHSSNSELRIRSPNLKIVKLFGGFTMLCLHAPLLVDMDVGLKDGPFTPKNQSSSCNYTNFFGGFPNLVELRGYGYFTKYLSIDIASYRPTLMLHHLKDVYLRGVEFGDTKEIEVVAHLIISAPNLHKLRLTTKSGFVDGVPGVSFKDFGCAPNFTLMKLTYVSFSFHSNYPSVMQLLKFLLETSPMLDTMKLQPVYRSSIDNVSTELLGFCRASPNVKITVV